MQKKIYVYFVIVLLISLGISGLITAHMVGNMYNKDVEDKLLAEADIIREQLADYISTNNLTGMQVMLNRINKDTNTRITVIDTSGKVLAETNYDLVLMGNHLQRPEVQQALAGQVGKQRRFSTTMQVNFLYIAEPVYQNSKITSIVRLATPLKELDGISRSISLSTLLALVPGLILALLLAYRFASNITRPIKEIKNAATEITQGRLDTEISIISNDEIGQLAKAIDFMAASMKDKINSIKDENTKMEAILSSVMNGIIAVDSEKHILFINPVAQKMMGIHEQNITGKHLLQVIRNNKLDNLIRSILEEQNVTDTELVLTYPEERICKVYTNPIKYTDSNRIIGIIIIIQDVTEIRKLEKLRSEFVANVSHELKTPLTSIKGFVETLKAGAIEDTEAAERFLNIIEDEADRLNRLITDILSLSELENKRLKANVEEIDVFSAIKEVVSMLQNQADKKGITLLYSLEEDIQRLSGDRDRFKQMLINLIDNAVKYTPDEGDIEIIAYNEGQNVVISIKDNGIGIPKEYIHRLFERFYTVDKARSKKLGGTGLGLAIVKHIVMQLDGKIEVQSEVGKGTEFTVTIPAKA